MTKPELMKALALRCQIGQQDAEEVIDVIFNAMSQAMARSERIEIRGFGSFTVNERKAHTARNPKTGAEVFVPRKLVPSFKPGKDLRELVEQPGA